MVSTNEGVTAAPDDVSPGNYLKEILAGTRTRRYTEEEPPCLAEDCSSARCEVVVTDALVNMARIRRPLCRNRVSQPQFSSEDNIREITIAIGRDERKGREGIVVLFNGGTQVR